MVGTAHSPPPWGATRARLIFATYMACQFLAIIVAPPLEEFLFRGVLFSGMARSLGPTIAALLVTAVFVVIHLPETIHYWPSAVAVLLLGATVRLMRIRSESLGPAITLHLAYNLVLVVTISLVPTRQIDGMGIWCGG